MRFPSLSALALALFVTSWALPGRAEEPGLQSPSAQVPLVDRPPPGARTTHLVAGAAVTAAFYGSGLGLSYLFPDAPGARDLRIPVAGPWLALRETGCAKDDPDCSLVIVVLRAALTVIGGVGQAGGLAVIGEGLLLDTAEPSRKAASASLRAVPLDFGRKGVGLGLVGAF